VYTHQNKSDLFRNIRKKCLIYQKNYSDETISTNQNKAEDRLIGTAGL
jgi:hypothetical protein